MVQVVVVANPANTNAVILKEFAPSINEKNITSLTMLDHNRALYQISEKLNVSNSDVKNVIIWGNHSLTMYPDLNHATVSSPNGYNFVRKLVADQHWYYNFFFLTLILTCVPHFQYVCVRLKLAHKALCCLGLFRIY